MTEHIFQIMSELSKNQNIYHKIYTRKNQSLSLHLFLVLGPTYVLIKNSLESEASEKTLRQGNRGDMRKIHVTQQFFEASGPQVHFFEKTKNPFLDKV